MRIAGVLLVASILGCGGRKSLTGVDGGRADAPAPDVGAPLDAAPEVGPPDVGPGVLIEATQPPAVVADPGIVDWGTPVGESPVGWDLCPNASGVMTRGKDCAACTPPPFDAGFLVYDGATATQPRGMNGQNAAIFFSAERTITPPVGLWFDVSLQEGDASDATVTFFPAPCQLEHPIGPFQLGALLAERGKWRSTCVPFPAPLTTYGLGFRFGTRAKLGLSALHLGPPCPGQPGTAATPSLQEICAKLDGDYASAVIRAKRCGFDGPTQCRTAAPRSLRCFCETYVYDARVLKVLAARWEAVECDLTGLCSADCLIETPSECVAGTEGHPVCASP